MEDRIEIPTSERDSSATGQPTRRLRTVSMFAFVVVAIIALTMSDAERNGIDPNPGGDEIAPPPTVEGDGTRPPLNSLALPGSGSVTAILELEGELVAIAAGDFWGSSI